jgi:hypothetical protein
MWASILCRVSTFLMQVSLFIHPDKQKFTAIACEDSFGSCLADRSELDITFFLTTTDTDLPIILTCTPE